MTQSDDASPLTLNRLSVYLRCLRALEEEAVPTVSSQALADRFQLSASQIRKDLAQFGEFGTRGVGYAVTELADHLHSLLGLDRKHRMIIVGMGNLGHALASYLGFYSGSFVVVAGVDNDPAKVGHAIGSLVVRHSDEIAAVVRESRAEIGVLTVPAEVAQTNYDALIEAGVRGIINFAPTRIQTVAEVPLKNVDLRIDLEALAYLLKPADPTG